MQSLAGSFSQVRAIVEVFANHCRRMVAEDTVLTPIVRQSLRDACRKTSEGHWELDTSVFTMKAETASPFSFKVGPGDYLQSASPTVEQKINAMRFHEWRIHALDVSDRNRRIAMTETTGAALQVLHDLVCLANQGTKRLAIWQEMIRRRRLSWPAPTTEWRFEGISAQIKWPAAEWSSFREFDYLFAHWNRVINWLDDGEKPPFDNAVDNLEALVFAWIDVCFMTLEPWERRRGQKPHWPTGFDGDKDHRWRRLINNLAKTASYLYKPKTGNEPAAEKVHVSQYRAQDWLTQWAVFLMPETIGTAVQPTLNKYLLQPKDTGEDLSALYELCKDRHMVIQGHRAKKLAYLWSRGMEKLAERLCNAPLPTFFNVDREGQNIFQPDVRRLPLLAAEIKQRSEAK
jgi:hypothetical protein